LKAIELLAASYRCQFSKPRAFLRQDVHTIAGALELVLGSSLMDIEIVGLNKVA
jgi:hypothetical protein